MNNKRVFKGDPASKQMSAEIADQLWPLYKESGGNAAETLRQAQAKGIEISKPTLDKLIKNFDFKGKLEQAQKNHFAASVDHTGELESLLAEVTGLKNGIQKVIKESPNDMGAHRMYGDHIGKILEIRRLMILAKQVDKDQLLIDALKEVIKFLMDRDLTLAAETVGDQLELISQNIKDRWASKAN